jgi:hypothetical protein
MIGRTKRAPLQSVSWPEAMDFFIEKFNAGLGDLIEIASPHGRLEGVAMVVKSTIFV